MADLNRSVRQLSWKENDQRKISPGAYIVQRLFFKGLIFKGAYKWRGLFSEFCGSLGWAPTFHNYCGDTLINCPRERKWRIDVNRRTFFSTFYLFKLRLAPLYSQVP